ncbi:hypothetical protein N7536_003807 [Penicillium majusculum]|nr:hypothetical protein N7536_003807 [Penicillium majusculum]
MPFTARLPHFRQYPSTVINNAKDVRSFHQSARMAYNHEILGSTPSVSIFCFSLACFDAHQREGCLG